MMIKIELSISLNYNGEEVSELTLDVNRILFHNDRLVLLHGERAHADLPITAIREVDLARKTFSIEDIRTDHPRAYEYWTPNEDRRLRELYNEGVRIDDIAKQLERQPNAVRARLSRLLID
jgi:hypothetical protein